MPDLRTALRDAAAVPPTGDLDEQDVRRRVRRRRRTRHAAGMLLVAAVALLGVRLAADLAPRPGVTFAEPMPAEPRWSPLPRAPLSPRFGSYAQWTGTEFVVWGGYAGGGTPNEGTAADGAAYDPETGRWRKLPDAPIPGLYSGTSAWSGEQLWIVGGIGEPYGRTSLRHAAAYDPRANAWRLLPDAPVFVSDGVWAGDRFVVLGSPARGGTEAELWSLRPGEDAWAREATDLTRGVLAAGEGGTVFVVTPDDDSVAVDLGGGQQVLPDRPGYEGRDEVAAAWTGEELLVLGDSAWGYRDGAWHERAGTFEGVPSPRLYPLDSGRVLALSQDGAVALLDVSAGTWARVPPGPLAGLHSVAAAVGGDRLLLWGGGSSTNLPTGDGAVLTLSPVDGVPAPDVRLYATSDSTLTTVDLTAGTSESRPLAQLAGGDPPFRLAARGDRLVFYGESGDTFVLEPDSGEVRELGASFYFIPSVAPDRVWLIDGFMSSDAPNRVREMAVDGTVTVPERELPTTGIPLVAVDGGLVLQTEDGLELWDAASNRVWRTLSGVFPVAATGDVVAWCDDPCTELRLTDVRDGDGDEAAVDLSEGYEGAFSPDGRHLAVLVGQTGLAIVDVARAEARVVPGAHLDHPELAWTPDSQAVLFPTADGRLGRYRLGAQEAETVPVELGDAVYGLAAIDAR